MKNFLRGFIQFFLDAGYILDDIFFGRLSPIVRYVRNILIGLDQLVTTFLAGYPDETISSWAHRMYVKGKWFGWTRNAINALFFLQEDHCLDAYEKERTRAQFPPLLR